MEQAELATLRFENSQLKGKIVKLNQKNQTKSEIHNISLNIFVPENLNIKLVHILLDPNHPEDIPLDSWRSTVDKQRKSRDLWESMSHKFTSYVPRLNVVNRTELPFENCAEPEIIDTSKELKNEPPVLTYGHYGCYKSNKDAIKEFESLQEA